MYVFYLSIFVFILLSFFYNCEFINKKIKQVDKFNYLRSLSTSNGKYDTDTEIKRRIGMDVNWKFSFELNQEFESGIKSVAMIRI